MINDEGNLAINPPSAGVASENEGLDLVRDHPATRVRQFEMSSQCAGTGAVSNFIQLTKCRAPENRAITILWERYLTPIVDAINISMAKKYGTLMGFHAQVVPMLRREGQRFRIPP